MGSSNNIAGATTTNHPVDQGLVQMFGVFFDTIVMCSATAFIILLSDVLPSTREGIAITQGAIVSHLGAWSEIIIIVSVFFFAYSSILANYVYSQNNLEFLFKNKIIHWIFNASFLFFIYFGAIQSLSLVLTIADLTMGIMALINLFALIMLWKYVFLALKDYDSQKKLFLKNPIFKRKDHPHLAQKLPHNTWTEEHS